MNKPKNILELVNYLKINPSVNYTNATAGIFDQERIFQRLDNGSLVWAIFDEKAFTLNIATTPILCKVADGYTLFDENGFTFVAFGIPCRFDYLEEKNACANKTN
jgi:hypothetical protein